MLRITQDPLREFDLTPVTSGEFLSSQLPLSLSNRTVGIATAVLFSLGCALFAISRRNQPLENPRFAALAQGPTPFPIRTLATRPPVLAPAVPRDRSIVRLTAPLLRTTSPIWEQLQKATKKAWFVLNPDGKVIARRIQCCDPAPAHSRYPSHLLPLANAMHTLTKAGDKRFFHGNRVGVTGHWTERVLYATESPTRKAVPQFWANVERYKIAQIIDLTTPADIQREKATKYYPSRPASSINSREGRFVRCSEMGPGLRSLPEITTRRCLVVHKENPQSAEKVLHEARHTHFKIWQDGTALPLDQLIELVTFMEARSPSPAFPMLVHCSAGIGRTGTAITALILKECIDRGRITEQNLADQLPALILSLRQERNPHFVWTPEQFDLLYRYGLYLLGRPPRPASSTGVAGAGGI